MPEPETVADPACNDPLLACATTLIVGTLLNVVAVLDDGDSIWNVIVSPTEHATSWSAYSYSVSSSVHVWEATAPFSSCSDQVLWYAAEPVTPPRFWVSVFPATNSAAAEVIALTNVLLVVTVNGVPPFLIACSTQLPTFAVLALKVSPTATRSRKVAFCDRLTAVFSAANNAGWEGSIVLDKVKNNKGAYGFNAATEEFEDLMKAGIVDPTKVVRTALPNAGSVAGLLLTTEAMVAEKPEEKKMPPMPGGGMEGMM